MIADIETMRTSTNTKNILVRLKTITGISNWNILCRWALCFSIKQKNLPRLVDEKLDGVEINYDTLVGKEKNVYSQLLINNLLKHGIEVSKDNLTKYLNAHVNRGVNIIYNYKLKNISGLFNLINS